MQLVTDTVCEVSVCEDSALLPDGNSPVCICLKTSCGQSLAASKAATFSLSTRVTLSEQVKLHAAADRLTDRLPAHRHMMTGPRDGTRDPRRPRRALNSAPLKLQHHHTYRWWSKCCTVRAAAQVEAQQAGRQPDAALQEHEEPICAGGHSVEGVQTSPHLLRPRFFRLCHTSSADPVQNPNVPTPRECWD